MQVEANYIKSKMESIKTENISGVEYIIGYLSKKLYVLAVCGPGKVNAAICAQTMALKYNVGTILNIGVAGGVSEAKTHKVKIGDIVIAKNVIQTDVDTSAVGDEVGMISKINIKYIPCTESLFTKAKNIPNVFENTEIHIGTVMTSDKFIRSKLELINLHELFGGIACEMESGSIGHVCFANHIKFLAIKVISDSADEDAHISYSQFLETSATKASVFLLELLKVL